MDKRIIFLKALFYVTLILLAIFSLFPGSLSGYLVFGDFARQPSLADNPFYEVIDSKYYQIGATINHFIIYFCISLLGFFIYLKNQHFNKIIYTLLFLAIILEVIQFIVPNRAFEFYDISANLAGILIAYLIATTYRIWSGK
tara:strand:- start:95 stop:520 length:426 start_codon:yes stop_codon:yes gene_type:complete